MEVDAEPVRSNEREPPRRKAVASSDFRTDSKPVAFAQTAILRRHPRPALRHSLGGRGRLAESRVIDRNVKLDLGQLHDGGEVG